MKVTYLDNSGFVITLKDAILVFDYYRDPSHALNKILGDKPDAPVVFFVSHRHPDHYNPGIYEIAQNHRRVYVMSNDVPAMKIPSTLEVQGMSVGDYVESLPGGISVRAYGSTDAGVSFLVTLADGRKIFHGGDLNAWHWQDESTIKEVEEANAAFMKIVNRVASDNPEMFMAMLAVDPRQGSDFARGARIFLDKVKVQNFFPMHFNGRADEACTFMEYASNAVKSYCLHNPGHSIELD